MKTLFALAVPLALLPACTTQEPGDTGTQVFQHGTDQLVECSNGGFVETTSTATVEGKYANGVGIEPESRGVEFTQITNSDGTITTPELAVSRWTPASLDQVSLDHTESMCADLVNRTWWTAPLTQVGAVTEYIDPTAPPTPATYRLILCPNGTLYTSAWFGIYSAPYSLAAGHVEAMFDGEATPEDIGTVLASAKFDTGTDPVPYWDQTTEEASAAANFCATGTWIAPN